MFAIWVAREFPIAFDLFMPILQFLSESNPILLPIYEIFNNKIFNEFIKK
jgi:hypothetical protein